MVPALLSAKVLEGFDPAGQPRLRAPRRPITLRHLLTHTAGFAYEIWRPEIAQYQSATNTPGITTCTNAALTTPLLFDPGDRWEYGISIDWIGKMVETVSGQKLDRYFQDNIFGPLGMKDTSFKLSPSQRARLASVHQRDDQGALAPIEFGLPEDPEFHMGGGGLYGTARDYLTFTQMIMQGGSLNGAQLLHRETVDLMAQNHIAPLDISAIKTAAPGLSNDVDLFPGMRKGWGLTFLINTQEAPTGRSAGSLAWAGLANTYFWIDRTKRVAGCSSRSSSRSTTTRRSTSSGSSRPRCTERCGSRRPQACGERARSARQTRSGVSGRSRSRTPVSLARALATAGLTGMRLPSPAPFAPNGPLPSAFSTKRHSSSAGTSSARGTRYTSSVPFSRWPSA